MSTGISVGRVGGLAAALGVGVAIWLGSPVASADDTSGGNASQSASSSSESTARSAVDTKPTHKKRRPLASSGAAADDSDTSTKPVAEQRRRPVQVAPVVASLKSEPPASDDRGGSVASPVPWVMAAAGRRELGRAEATSRATAGVTVVGSVSRTGHQTTTASFNADGSRATVTTASANYWKHVITTKVSVFDTNTGRQIGRTTTTTSGAAVLDTAATTLDGDGSSVLNPAGTRAVITTGATDSTTGAYTTQVTVIDSATGDQVGGVTTLAGQIWPAPVLFGADGIHAVITTSASDPVTGAYNMQYSTIDTDTGAKVGTTLVLPHFPSSSPVFSNDRKNVTFTTSGGNANMSTTWVGVIDTSSGTQIGSTLAYSGAGGSFPTFSDDGSRVLMLTTASYPPPRFGTQASVVSTITGTQIGKSLTFAGSASGVMSADGAHAVILSNTINLLALTTTTRVSFLRIT